MAALQQACVLALSFAALQVWERVSARLPRRVALVDRLHGDLRRGEDDGSALLATLLLDLVATLADVAHSSPGEVERLMEAEALEANRTKLANLRAYAALVSKLHVAEVQLEKAVKERYEQGVRDWRVLRTRRAMDNFNARLRSAEYAAPEKRAAEFAALRAGQRAHFAALGGALSGALAARHTMSDDAHAARCELSSRLWCTVTECYATGAGTCPPFDPAVHACVVHQQHSVRACAVSKVIA
jgi:Domain of unknown function (DUF4455)